MPTRCDPQVAHSGWEDTLEHYVGLDVSLESASVCVVNCRGEIVREAKVASDSEAVSACLCSFEPTAIQVGLEAGPLSQWLYAGLTRAGFQVVLLETRHVKAAVCAMAVKTDRRDARGIAQLMRLGWYRPVHAKSLGAQEVRAALVARTQLLNRMMDLERSMRGILRGFGLRVGQVTRRSFEGRIRELVEGHSMLQTVMSAMLTARATLMLEMTKLHKVILKIVREDEVCRRLMTVPGVGALTSITFKSAVDDPSRIARSRGIGPLFGLTPRKYQSGETDRTGAITRSGDAMVRTALYEAANSVLCPGARFSALKRWALGVAARRGAKKAKVALARKIGVILHRMWVEGTNFRWTREMPLPSAA